MRAVASRAAAPAPARRGSEDSRAHPATSMASQDLAFDGGGGGSTPGFGGLSSAPFPGSSGYPGQTSYPSMSSPDAYPQGGVANGQLIGCPDCGRKFNADSIDRHIKICKKVFVNKRQQFSSAANRLGEFEDAQQLIANAERQEASREAPEKKVRPANASDKVPAWKKKSLEFRQAMAAAKAATGDESAQEKVDEIQKQLTAVGNQADPDKMKCPHCGRTFNKEAGERHVAICVKTFGSKPGGGRLIKGGGQRMFKDDAKPGQSAEPSRGGGRPLGSASVSNTSTPTAQAAQVSRMGSAGQGLETAGAVRGGSSLGYGSSVVRTSSGAGGFPTSGYSAAGGGYSAGASAQNRRPSAHRQPSRGGSSR